jgi:hypothetical protein
MKLLAATIQKAPRIVDTKFGKKCVTDCKLDDGQTLTLWQPPTSKLINYGTGERISLTVDSKGKHHFLENGNDDAIAAKSEPTNHKLSNAQKKEIASYIEQQKDLLAFCWQQACLIDDIQSEDTIQKMAVTLYLSAQRKFNLAN